MSTPDTHLDYEQLLEKYMPPNYRGERWCGFPGCHGFEDPMRGMPRLVRYGAHSDDCPLAPYVHHLFGEGEEE